jgi:hypothetical protein
VQEVNTISRSSMCNLKRSRAKFLNLVVFGHYSLFGTHAYRSCSLEFQHYVGWGRIVPFCHEPSFF